MAVTHSVVLYDPKETSAEVKAAAGFLGGYSGPARRTRSTWANSTGGARITTSGVRGEAHAHRALRPRARGARPGAGDDRPPPVNSGGLLPLRPEEGVIEHSLAVHVRRPRLDYESHAVGLDRNELGAFLVAAGLSSAREHRCAPCWR